MRQEISNQFRYYGVGDEEAGFGDAEAAAGGFLQIAGDTGQVARREGSSESLFVGVSVKEGGVDAFGCAESQHDVFERQLLRGQFFEAAHIGKRSGAHIGIQVRVVPHPDRMTGRAGKDRMTGGAGKDRQAGSLP